MENCEDGKPWLLVTEPLHTVRKMPVMELFRLGARVKVLLEMEPCAKQTRISARLWGLCVREERTMSQRISGGRMYSEGPRGDSLHKASVTVVEGMTSQA